MKKMMFLAMAVAAMMVCAPVNAQSRKDKKEAAKAQWEMEQQQKQEEAALLHQMKMDSIRNAQKVREAEAAKAEAAARQAEIAQREREAEEAAARKRAEQAARQTEVEVTVPCSGLFSTNELLRASGIGESMQQQMAKRIAYTNAIRELGSKIETSIQALTTMYFKDMMQNMEEDIEQRYEGMIKEVVDQKMGYRTLCEKYTSYYNDKNVKTFKCYLSIEVGVDELLQPVYQKMQEAAKNKIDADYQEFKGEFNKVFQQNEAL